MILAISTSGRVINIKGKHPRKELLAALNRQHAERIIRGRTLVGYIIARKRWYFFSPVEWPLPLWKGE